MSTKKIQIIGSPYVAYNEQTLTDEQKAQVRENIGAVSENTLANYETYITLQMFGAVGDGVADDTAAVKAAIDAAKADNKPIYVTEGTYNLTDILTTNGIDLVGVNPEKCVFHIISQATSREHFIDCYNVNIRNIKFKMSCAGALLAMYDSDNVIVDNCIFMFEELTSGTKATLFDLYRANTNVKISNCQFLNYSKVDTGCIDVRNASAENITKNIVFENCDFKHATKDEAIAVWGWNGTVEDVLFQNCSFEDVDSEFTPAHFITLGMDGVSRNLTMDNCKVYHRYANACTIKSTVYSGDNNVVENVNINNCYFEINSGDIHSNYSFCTNQIGILKINNCVINANNHVLFDYAMVNNCDIKTNSYLADFSIFNNSTILFTNCDRMSQKSIELYNCVVDYNNVELNKTLFQPLVANSKIVIDNCEFKNMSAFTAGRLFHCNVSEGLTIEITNSKIAYCNIYAASAGLQLTMFNNIITGSGNNYWSAEGVEIVTNVHDNIVNGVYCMHGLTTSADDHINSLIAAATELPSVTTSDSGKFLRVSADGTWVAETIPQIEEVAF